MQADHAQVLTPPPPRPVSWKGNEEAAGASHLVTPDSSDARTEDERLMDEEIERLLYGEPTPEQDKELMALNGCESAPEREEVPLAVPIGEPAPKKATFEPSTRMHSGKPIWGRTRFIAVPHALLTHEVFAELSGRACKLLLAMARQYVGNNNGHLIATASRMRASGFNSKDSLAKSIQELIDFGYIVRTRSQECRLPALYAITWFPINKAPKDQPYDPGIAHSDEASDLWRYTDPLKAKGKVVARKAAGTFRKLGLDEREIGPLRDAALTTEALH